MKAPGRPELASGSAEAQSSLQRIDQWLWFARIAKSRTLAQALIARGKVRVNRVKIDKTSTTVKPGDVLTLSLGPRVISIEIVGIGVRRGPAPEAQALYRDLTPKPAPQLSGEPGSEPQPSDGMAMASGLRPNGSGRPTKRERRLLDKIRGRE
ncbi:RNA-binding S4 domain-containing protein [Hyphomicrobium sp.]|uniref:RNA-binding S4 domain-containing protein n=1 Tax=Hyphomicrobium sp. TaxID=82 RepID=UPI000FC09A4A|nr:RNA-binding S4 domain-containing protein [Hyphomicrobium sp.]RUO98660.1 MAG: RNA-binding S4 domain-containing protein [Hyphomicrobium sp.]